MVLLFISGRSVKWDPEDFYSSQKKVLKFVGWNDLTIIKFDASFL